MNTYFLTLVVFVVVYAVSKGQKRLIGTSIHIS